MAVRMSKARLRLGRNNIEQLAQRAQDLVQQLSTPPVLEVVRLDFAHLEIQDQGALEALVASLGKCVIENLQLFVFHRDVLTEDNKAMMVPSLIQLVAYPTKKLHMCPSVIFAMESHECTAFHSALVGSKYFHNLEICLSGDSFWHHNDTEAFFSVADWLAHSKFRGSLRLIICQPWRKILTRLLHANALGCFEADLVRDCEEADLQDFEAALAANTSLVSLRIYPSGSSPTFVAAVQALTKNTSLSILSVDPRNTDYLVAHLPAMKGVKVLETVWPADQALSERLLDALQRNTSVIKVDRGQGEGDPCANAQVPNRALGKILQRNRDLAKARRVVALQYCGELPLLLSSFDSADIHVSGTAMYALVRKFLPSCVG